MEKANNKGNANLILLFIISLALIAGAYLYFNGFTGKTITRNPNTSEKFKDAVADMTLLTAEDPRSINIKNAQKTPGRTDLEPDVTHAIEMQRGQNSPADLRILDEVDAQLNQKMMLVTTEGTPQITDYYKERSLDIWYEFTNDQGDTFYGINTTTYYRDEDNKIQYAMSGHLALVKKSKTGKWEFLKGTQNELNSLLCSDFDKWGIPSKYRCIMSDGRYSEGEDFVQR